ncbi:DUF29 domain-containing protein [Aphanothece sacrum]|uniref:DUF29 domain-containing protein n=1 Tax=Aphanothece sacrum FPU1 TaxID=1920663 RepID=A0A401IIP1_APHSA|nr:DUF29 domain-containing protein [Aphanothece sacrum]GBF80981.1 hypothetical protein AsFPU1_2390 [Aphanothece sacrum FPU1]GBF85288.1 hypothetical protein AsFPU3_2347 [Aphanothece sacrum FPU3]
MSPISELYDQDFQVWLAETISQLEQANFQALDVHHLIEELRDLGKSEKNSLEGNLMILLAHLLKLRVQSVVPDTMKSSWYRSIIEHRERVILLLENTPSLKYYLTIAVNKAYPKGRKIAVKEGQLASFGIPIPKEEDYPLGCPFSLEEILDEDFYGLS